MKHLRLKLASVMISTTVFILVVAIITINFLSQRMIFDRVDNALMEEARYYKNAIDVDYKDSDVLFEITPFYIEDYKYTDQFPANERNVMLSYYSETEQLFYKKYINNQLPLGDITRIRADNGDYYVLLIQINQQSQYMMNIMRAQTDANTSASIEADLGDMAVTGYYAGNVDVNAEVEAEAGVEAKIASDNKNILHQIDATDKYVVLYTDVSITSNIVDLLNKIFYILLLFSIIIEGVVGILMGTKLEDSQQKLRYFFQNASHELKSPLMSVQGYAEGIQKGIIVDPKDASEVIIKKSDQMRKLIDEMLMLSKLDSNAYTFDKRRIDIRNIIDDSIDNFVIIAKQKSLDIQLEYEHIDAEVIGDDLQLYKVFNTVIDNAFKFAQTKVCIKSEIKGKTYRTTIYNDGKSIDQTDLVHIFDRFYSGNHISTGIGLAMAKEIVKQSGGNLLADNQADGVIFTIDLPLARKGARHL